MREKIRSLAKQSSVYALGNFGVKVGGFLLAPLVLNPRYLTVESYGYLALMLVTAQLGSFVAGLGISSGLLRFWTHPDYQERKMTLASTAYALSVVLGVSIPALVYVLFSKEVASLLLDSPDRTHLFGLVLAYSGLKIIGQVPLTLFRVREKPLLYASFQLTEVVLLVALAYEWLVVDGLGLTGIIQSYVVAAALTTIVSSIVALAPIRWGFDAKMVRPLIVFGAPLALASLSYWILSSSDRYLLKWLTDPSVVATYDWASRVASTINILLVQSFQLAFVVIGLRHLDERDKSLHQEMFRHFVAWTGWFVLALGIFTEDAMRLMTTFFGTDESYVQTSSLVLLVGVGFWFYGTNQIVASVLSSAGRTSVIALSVGLSAIVNICLNLWLIPLFGGSGAAAATAVAYLVLMGSTTVFAEKHMPIGYSWMLAGSAVLFVFALFALSGFTRSWQPALGITSRFVLVAGYMPLLLLTGNYQLGEFKGGLRMVVGVLRR